MADISPYAQDIMLQAFATASNAGSTMPNAYLNIYTAPKPMSPIDGATGLLLATFLLPDPAIIGPVEQQLLLQLGGITTTVIADGKAAWCRFRTKDNTTMFDGTVGLIGSGTDLELEEVDLKVSDIINPGNIPLRLRC